MFICVSNRKNVTIMRKFILYFAVAVVAAFQTGCYEDHDMPAPAPVYNLTPTMTIKGFKALYNQGVRQIDDDIIIGGRINSTDRYGNIYRELYIQDETSGIKVKIGQTNLYNYYKPGQMLYVKAKTLWLGAYGGFIELGAESVDPRYETGYIDVQLHINMTIFPGAQGDKVEPREVTAYSQLNDDMLGTLIKAKGLTFHASGTPTWAIPDDKDTDASEAQTINQDFTFSDNPTYIVVRTSGYAEFASRPVPADGSKVNITAILTKFGNTYQLILNSIEDVQVL